MPLEDPTRALRLLAFQKVKYAVEVGKEEEEEVKGGEDCGTVVPTTVTTTTVTVAVALAVEKDSESEKEEARKIEKGDGDGGNGRGIADSIKRSSNPSKNKGTDSMNVSVEGRHLICSYIEHTRISSNGF